MILEALAAGNCVLVNDHAPNVETVGDAGLTFSGKAGVPSLTAQLERLFDEPELVDGASAAGGGPQPVAGTR